MLDRKLLQDCIDNKAPSQREFYWLYHPILAATSRRYVQCSDSAKDVLQTSWLKIFRKMHSDFDNETHLLNWMKRIVINESINYYKKQDVYKTNIQEMVINGVDKEYNHDGFQLKDFNEVRLKRALNSLDKIYQDVIKLKYIEGYNHTEVANMLGIATSSSRSRLNRGLQKLRTFLESQDVFKN